MKLILDNFTQVLNSYLNTTLRYQFNTLFIYDFDTYFRLEVMEIELVISFDLE